MLNPEHIKFKNSQNTKSGFDIITLESLFRRKDLDHSPFDFHLVEFYLLLIIEEGTGKHTIDFTTYKYTTGDIITIRKDQIHKFHFDASVKGSVLLFTDDFLVSYLEKLEALKSLQLFNELLGKPKIALKPDAFKDILAIVHRLKTEYFNINDTYSLGIIRSELHILLAKLFRMKYQNDTVSSEKKHLNDFVRLQNLVETHALQHKKVNYYANQLAKSTKTLNNITKSIIHKSTKDFIDDIATKQIKRLLINTTLNIKEIAYVSGFEETTNFYKYFKRQTNFTPEAFRTKNK
ncbi:AraC family transcriptional regulator [Seonamhaeicola marinus]|uniref:Helix-turn-helix domain-containing protein n=1 Tax=Seonamhaeicola marinus TaxID=1912246 RepID=A0A5D0HTR9_9FLAO|nr:helix-turn-helix transcriptional regulator [Seonamhaeicola marinus]TYA74754.1 helix-turn-helix domain-containing protein [Seonamhaeicola marinus]